MKMADINLYDQFLTIIDSLKAQGWAVIEFKDLGDEGVTLTIVPILEEKKEE
jgi:hypothetical protein